MSKETNFSNIMETNIVQPIVLLISLLHLFKKEALHPKKNIYIFQVMLYDYLKQSPQHEKKQRPIIALNHRLVC